jgi:hypothetical protein
VLEAVTSAKYLRKKLLEMKGGHNKISNTVRDYIKPLIDKKKLRK